jgi:hypothetical protein
MASRVLLEEIDAEELSTVSIVMFHDFDCAASWGF